MASSGVEEGLYTNAGFGAPWFVTGTTTSNGYLLLWVTEISDSVIRTMSTSGYWRTLAGGAGDNAYVDGSGTVAKFDRPSGICFGPGDSLYVVDTANNAIRVVTLAGGDSCCCCLFYFQFCVPVKSSVMLLLMYLCVLFIVVTTLAGSPSGTPGYNNGIGTNASFVVPTNIAVSFFEDTLYVCDTSTVRKISVSTSM